MRQFYCTFPIRDTLCPELSWLHYRVLMRINDEQARRFYMEECAKAAWSVRQLERQSRMVPVTLSTDLPEEERTGIGLRLRLLYKLIAELPEMDRILISLELEDVRQAEIARITGLSEGNVRVRIHRIKALLTKKIRAYEE